MMTALRKVTAFGVVLSGLMAMPAHSLAQSSLWDHNGSMMRLEEKDEKRRFVYQSPREALKSAGVKPGTILFDGTEKKDGRLAGYAKLFRTGCDPVDYFVEGAYDKTKGKILLQGQAPIYSGNGCKITGYTDDGSASSLKFTRESAPPRAIARSARAEEDPRYGPDPNGAYRPPRSASPAEDAPAYATPRRDDRDYAYQGRRPPPDRPYDRGYRPEPEWDQDPYDYEDYDDDYVEEPAYVPYQPRWRRNVY